MGKAYFKITFKKNFSLTIQPLINIVQASIPVRGAEEKKGGGGTAAAGGQASHKRGRHSKTASHQRRRPKTISPTHFFISVVAATVRTTRRLDLPSSLLVVFTVAAAAFPLSPPLANACDRGDGKAAAVVVTAKLHSLSRRLIAAWLPQCWP